MQIPFTVEQFLEVFGAYNTAIWPAQYLAYAIGTAIIWLAVSRIRGAGGGSFSLLALLWGFTGVAYQLVYFAQINAAARIFGILFILQALVLLGAQWVERPRLRVRVDLYGIVGVVFVLYAMVSYPLVGRAFGHGFPEGPVFGLTPCPLTIFTFGVLLWTDPSLPKWVPIIPFIWSLIGSTAAFSLGIPEDYGLLVAGLVGTVMLWRRQHRPETDEPGTPGDAPTELDTG